MVTKLLVTVSQERRLVHQSVYICNFLDCFGLRLKTYSAIFHGISLESTSLHYCKHDVLAYNGLMGPLLIINPSSPTPLKITLTQWCIVIQFGKGEVSVNKNRALKVSINFYLRYSVIE